MAGHTSSLYTRFTPVRHISRLLSLVPLLALAACGSVGSLDEITGSIGTTASPPQAAAAAPAPPAKSAIANPSDLEAVKRSVVRAPVGTRPSRIEWNNAETGNSGTISDVIAAAPRAGGPCRGFATTVTSVDGIRAYRGEVCRAGRDGWDFVTVEPVEREGPKDRRDPG